MKTLEQYFHDALTSNVIDHSIRASFRNGKVFFYIHPEGVSGETLDFEINGNHLVPAGWAASFPPKDEKPVWHCRRCNADVNPKTMRCKCTTSPSPWEPLEPCHHIQ